MADWERFFVDGPEAASGRCELVSGAVPPDLTGSFVRNGGGRFRVGRDRVGFFDAHSLVGAVGFRDGKAWWRAAMVDTPLAREEVAAGRVTRRRTWASGHGGWWMNALQGVAAEPASHDAFAWRGRLLASGVGASQALDRSLRTLGGTRVDPGATRAARAAPMPQLDPVTGHLVGFTLQSGGLRADHIGFVEAHADGTVRRAPWVALGGAGAVVHAVAFSARWYVAVELPGRLARLPALFGTSTLADALRAPDGATCTLVLAPRGRAGAPVRIPLPGAAAILHVANAFDDGGLLVVDAAVHAKPPDLGAVGLGAPPTGSPPALVRYVVNPDARTVAAEPVAGPASDCAAVDPRRRGARARWLWGPVPGDGPVPDFYGYYRGIARFEPGGAVADSWMAEGDGLVSPPALAPEAGSDAEGRGWLLAWVTRPEGTSVVVLDPLDLAAGPFAELALGVALPVPGHCRFLADFMVTAPDEDDWPVASREDAIRSISIGG